MEVFKESAQSQIISSQGTVSTRKRAGLESSDAAMKRQYKEQTSAQDVSGCGNLAQRTRQTFRPSLPSFPGGLMQAHYLESPCMETESPCMETHVGEAAMGKRPNEKKKQQK